MENCLKFIFFTVYQQLLTEGILYFVACPKIIKKTLVCGTSWSVTLTDSKFNTQNYSCSSSSINFVLGTSLKMTGFHEDTYLETDFCSHFLNDAS